MSLKSPKELFTAIETNSTENQYTHTVYYLGIEIGYFDRVHEQMHFKGIKFGFDCEQLIDIANFLKILHLNL